MSHGAAVAEERMKSCECVSGSMSPCMSAGMGEGARVCACMRVEGAGV